LAEEGPTLYVSGAVSNQGRFYDRFDAVVLLSAPADVLLARIANRTTNDYGKSRGEHELILDHLREVEPLLRATCTHEIDATLPPGDVVDRSLRLARQASVVVCPSSGHPSPRCRRTHSSTGSTGRSPRSPRRTESRRPSSRSSSPTTRASSSSTSSPSRASGW